MLCNVSSIIKHAGENLPKNLVVLKNCHNRDWQILQFDNLQDFPMKLRIKRGIISNKMQVLCTTPVRNSVLIGNCY